MRALLLGSKRMVEKIRCFPRLVSSKRRPCNPCVGGRLLEADNQKKPNNALETNAEDGAAQREH